MALDFRKGKMSKLLSGGDLEKRCQELGIDITDDPAAVSTRGSRSRASDAELQRRLIEAERSLREHRLWILAFVSAIASVVSAIVAFFAVMAGK